MDLPTNDVTFVVRVHRRADEDAGGVQIKIKGNAEFAHAMMAAEAMVHFAAQHAAQATEIGYERAVEMIAQGAMNYRGGPKA